MTRPRKAKTHAALVGVLLDVAPSLIAYYGLRALGVSQYPALLTATIVAGVKVLYEVIRARRFDPFAGYLLLSFGLSLAVGIATSNPRLLLVGDAGVSGICGLVFLGSAVVGTPMTALAAARSGRAEDDDSADAAVFRLGIHRRLSLLWGVSMLVGTAAHLVVVFTLPIDAAKGLGTVITLVTTAVAIGLTLLVVARARRRRQSLVAEREQSTPTQS